MATKNTLMWLEENVTALELKSGEHGEDVNPLQQQCSARTFPPSLLLELRLPHLHRSSMNW